jgi:chromosome partitioning protein
MLDTVQGLLAGSGNEARIFRCVLTQTTRDSVISKHVREELLEAGLPLLRSELTSRVAYPEAALYGATPNLLQQRGPAARDIAAIATEVDELCGSKLAAVA